MAVRRTQLRLIGLFPIIGKQNNPCQTSRLFFALALHLVENVSRRSNQFAAVAGFVVGRDTGDVLESQAKHERLYLALANGLHGTGYGLTKTDRIEVAGFAHAHDRKTLGLHAFGRR